MGSLDDVDADVRKVCFCPESESLVRVGGSCRAVNAEPISAYLMKGESRTEWKHSIPAIAALRYSVGFRNFKDAKRANAGTPSCELRGFNLIGTIE
jgi:hypothetical protein